MRLSVILLCMGLLSCKRAEVPPPSRVPNKEEAGHETVLDGYHPRRLRLFPDEKSGQKGRYVAWASEHPELPAPFRPLAVVERPPRAGFVARASDFVWSSSNLIEGEIEGEKARLVIHDPATNRRQHRDLQIPAGCRPRPPVLLQRHGDKVHGALRCQSGDRAVLFVAGQGEQPEGAQVVDGAGELQVFLHDAGAGYLLAWRKVIRVSAGGQKTIGTVPPPGGDAETRDALVWGDELLIIDGGAGRVIRMGRDDLRWRREQRFPAGRRTSRARAVMCTDHLMVVWAEQGGEGSYLFGIGLALSGPTRETTRLILGPSLSPADHDLVPTDGPSCALLLRTRRGQSGPEIVLSRLNF